MMARTGNRILDRLPEQEREKLLSVSERIVLPAGQELYRQNGSLTHVFFPVEGMWSLVIPMNEGRIVEVSVVGREGMLGLDAYLHANHSDVRSLAQSSSETLRVPFAHVAQMTSLSGNFDVLMRRYTAFSQRSTMQSIACTALHTARERVCRWLLLAQDHIGHDEFALTHERLAELLAMRRQTVTTVFGVLQREQIISCTRGTIRVVDRAALEATACECYRRTQSLYERMMNGNGYL
jgi:CRP-like cAMP-binding protein